MIIIHTNTGTIVFIQDHPSVTTTSIDNIGTLDLKKYQAELAEEYAEQVQHSPAFVAPRSHTTTLTNGRERPSIKASGYG